MATPAEAKARTKRAPTMGEAEAMSTSPQPPTSESPSPAVKPDLECEVCHKVFAHASVHKVHMDMLHRIKSSPASDAVTKKQYMTFPAIRPTTPSAKVATKRKPEAKVAASKATSPKTPSTSLLRNPPLSLPKLPAQTTTPLANPLLTPNNLEQPTTPLVKPPNPLLRPNNMAPPRFDPHYPMGDRFTLPKSRRMARTADGSASEDEDEDEPVIHRFRNVVKRPSLADDANDKDWRSKQRKTLEADSTPRRVSTRIKRTPRLLRDEVEAEVVAGLAEQLQPDAEVQDQQPHNLAGLSPEPLLLGRHFLSIGDGMNSKDEIEEDFCGQFNCSPVLDVLLPESFEDDKGVDGGLAKGTKEATVACLVEDCGRKFSDFFKMKRHVALVHKTNKTLLHMRLRRLPKKR